jgi:hypothetical protein
MSGISLRGTDLGKLLLYFSDSVGFQSTSRLKGGCSHDWLPHITNTSVMEERAFGKSCPDRIAKGSGGAVSVLLGGSKQHAISQYKNFCGDISLHFRGRLL